MSLGLGSYAFFWQHSERASTPTTIVDELRATRELGLDRFQICDDPRMPATPAGLAELRSAADELGVALELGTRGVAVDHLEQQIAAAEAIGATTLRSMLTSGDDRPSAIEAEMRLRRVAPRLADAGVTLALETYEQVPTATLIALVEELGDERIGICLDPANTVAALEDPADVIRRCARYTVNLHVKDFAFDRNPGWVGFVLAGAPLGEGLLDLELLRTSLDLTRVHAIVEHWLPWQGDEQTTMRAERAWTAQSAARWAA